MAYTFDGTNKLIVLSLGTTSVSVQDMYSRWKDWVRDSEGSKYDPAFRAVGGDPTVGGNFVAPYFFLTNGWRVQAANEDHTLYVDGALVVDGGGDPYQNVTGTHEIHIIQTVPVRAELTSSNSYDLAVALLDEQAIETGLTMREALRLLTAASAGKLSGAETTTITIRNTADTKDRITATVDTPGNRSAVVYDLTDD